MKSERADQPIIEVRTVTRASRSLIRLDMNDIAVDEPENRRAQKSPLTHGEWPTVQ